MSWFAAAALDYLRLGWVSIPLRFKRPLIAWKCFQKRRPTQLEVRSWWQRWPDANVGLVMGAVSGMFALDLDRDPDALLNSHGVALPVTPTSETGGGGLHILFRHPGEQIPNGVKLLVAPASNGGKAPQADVRGDGGYIVAPPSLHGSGGRYAWRIPPSMPLAPAPPELLALIRNRAGKLEASGPACGRSWLLAALRGPILEGQRNATAARLVGHFLRRGRHSPDEILALLTPWTQTVCVPPMHGQELRRVVESIARREEASRRARRESRLVRRPRPTRGTAFFCRPAPPGGIPPPAEGGAAPTGAAGGGASLSLGRRVRGTI